MARIPFVQSQVGGPGVADLAQQRPNQAFTQLGQEAARTDAVLEALGQREAAAEGAKVWADFRIARQKRQQEMRDKATTPAGFSDAAAVDFDEQAQALIDAQKNSGVQAYLSGRLREGRVSEVSDAVAWESQARHAVAETQLDEALNKNANFVQSNPGKFESILSDSEAALAASGLPLAAVERKRAGMRAQLAQSAVYGQIETNPYGVLKQLQGGQWDSHLAADAKISAVNAAQGEIKRRESEAQARRAAQSDGLITGVQVAINRFGNGQGNFTQTDLDGLKGRLAPDPYNRLQMQFDDARAKREGEDGDRSTAASLIESGHKIDPGNTKLVKGYDSYFQKNFLPAVAANVATLPPDQRASALNAQVLAFVGNQGVVPETLKASIRTSLRSGSHEEKVQATQLLDQLRNTNPQIVNDFSTEEIRLGSMISANIDRGLAPDMAARAATEALTVPKATQEVLSKAFDPLTRQRVAGALSPQQMWLRSALADWSHWSSSINVLPSIAAEIDETVRNEFISNGGDIDAARISGLSIAKARYGISEVNGGADVMRNPPEQHYQLPWMSPSETAKAIRSEAITAMSQDVLIDPRNPPSPDTVRLMPYPIAGKVSPDGKPTYALQTKNAAGEWYTARNAQGEPLAWYPSLEKERAAHDAKRVAAISEARGEVPAGASVEGTQVFSRPKGNWDDVGNQTGGAPRRMIGYIKNGKFVRQGPN